VFDPATGQQIAATVFATPSEVDLGVAAAKAAAGEWAAASLGQRAAVMFRIREVLLANLDELAAAITAENGKTLEDARGEVKRGIECVEYACGIPQLLDGQHSTNAGTGIDLHTIRQPLGVVAAITPFNFPVMVPLWIIANGLACGNTMVLKPSEKDPSAPLMLAGLFEEAGLPSGVFNVVNGGVEAVDQLLEHPDVAAVSSVGSTPVARQIYLKATAAGKRVQALGGAKNHMVVFPDADLDAAADAAIAAGYGAAGERCMAISMIVAVGGVGPRLVDAVRKRALDVKVGPGTSEGVDMGPLITEAHRDRVASYLDVGASEGATVVLDGRDSEIAKGPGFFLSPSLLDDVAPGTRVHKEEIFGPVLGVTHADGYADAVALVDEHEFANGAAIFTRDGGTARRFQLDCEIGMIGVNVPIPVPVAWSSFGGWKSSLFGDTHMYGPEGVHFFTRQKVVTSRWP
jgi:malonate-semialdehyde dehydrogenase (acetylating)/methylmalonate-semialdehyde dehydrogenase